MKINDATKEKEEFDCEIPSEEKIITENPTSGNANLKIGVGIIIGALIGITLNIAMIYGFSKFLLYRAIKAGM